MNKKFITLLILGVLGVTMVGCGNKEKEEPKPTETKPPVTDTVKEEQKEETEEKVVEEKEESKETEKKGDSTVVKGDSTVIVDSKLVKISCTGKEDGITGLDIKLEIENKGDKKITVQVKETSADGVMVEPATSIDVMPGKKAVDVMTIMEDNVKDVTQMEGVFDIIDASNWDTIEDAPFNITFEK